MSRSTGSASGDTEVSVLDPMSEAGQRLTPRERQVLQQAALGMSNRRIGEELHIAEQTVKNHLSSAMRKLSLRDRTSAVVVAIGQGLISIPNVTLQEPMNAFEHGLGQLSQRPPKPPTISVGSSTDHAETRAPTR